MSMFELEHPLGQDLETIQGSMFAGMDQIKGKLPDEVAINYEDALSSGVGVSTLRIANWATKNQAALYYPLAVAEDDPTWLVRDDDGLNPLHVRHRVYVVDMLGRGFNFRLEKQDDEYALTPYMQFDIVDDGVILSVKIKDEVRKYFGQYESDGYSTLALAARNLVKLDLLKELAA